MRSGSPQPTARILNAHVVKIKTADVGWSHRRSAPTRISGSLALSADRVSAAADRVRVRPQLRLGSPVVDLDPSYRWRRLVDLMSVARWSVSLVAVVGIVAATLAAATIWLLLTDPVGGAEAVSEAMTTGDLTPFDKAIGTVIFEALRDLFRYL